MSRFSMTERYSLESQYQKDTCIMPTIDKPTIPPFPTPSPTETVPPDTSETAAPSESPVSVYVRVRPLIQEECSLGLELMPGLATTSSDPTSTCVPALQTPSATVGGFQGVLGPEADNEAVFERCFESRLETVVLGGTASLFCYGYTGSGKTHTVLGYRGEQGLYQRAAGALLDRVRETLPGEDLFLAVTACEIYGDSVYDLLGEEKLPATLRTDEDGNLRVCGPAVKCDLGEMVAEFQSSVLRGGKDLHATIVTRTPGLRCGQVRTVTDLDAFSSSALQLRSVGSSSEHGESSRSHAVLRMEVMNREMFEAREAAEDARVLLAPLMSAIDNYWRECLYSLFDVKSMGKDGMMGLRQYPGGEEEWERVRAELEEKKEKLEAAIVPVMSRIQSTYQTYSEVRAPEAVGGALVLVDLAGADYDKRDLSMTTVQQRKESSDINKSLLALKECFRSIGGTYGNKVKPPFRNSKLTRLLEDSLLPGAQSSRRNRASVSVMIVNVSPAEHIATRTLNVLRYGQIFAEAKSKNDKMKSVKKVGVKA